MLHHRQLAAIMFTDIEGYTAAMQQNEQKAIELRDRHRQVLQEAHKEFSGRIVQYYGDGTLSIFQSAVTAVQCALSVQLQFCQRPEVPVRIGLHIGDIIFDDEQVLGDGVNVASRIESLGLPGCVLLSDKVRDEVSNHPDLKVVSVGIYQLKNINRPVEVFALDHPGLVKPKPDSLQGKTTPKRDVVPGTGRRIPAKSVAVLPFVNISNDPEQDYFSTGIAEEILNSLSNLKDLKVAGRTSSSHYNRENVGLREIGERLGVKTILEGSVRKQGNRLRIMVQLVNVNDGFHLWSQKYDRSMDDIFAIQDEVALAVTEKLKVTLLEKDKVRITKTRTKNTEAYELYLKGRFYLSRRGGAIMTGMHFFQLAIDLDPDFALAYTGLADAGIMAAIYGLAPPKQVALKAKQAAEKALQLDSQLSEPYCSLGAYYTIFDWNWSEAEKYFSICLDRNPGYTQAHYWYGFNYLTWVKNDLVEAEKHGRLATELEPLSAICYGMYGAILLSA
ncbi:MAG TPA: adenylate/guanylate cyclase domain-containing protein, partial [Chitinophagaceae bacterium]|nr:adenylate/guanylate cyclase domain-containing protein [Chitinophagaceae bacterium]